MALRARLGKAIPAWPDVLFAGLMLVLVEQDLWIAPDFGHRVGPRTIVAGFYAASALVLAWRRRAPLHVLAVVAALVVGQSLAYGGAESLGSFLPPLVALYSVGRHAPARAVSIAVPLTAVAVAIHDGRDPVFSASGPAFFFWAILAAAWPVGRAFRRREVAIGTLSAHAVALVRQREEQTRAAIEAERARIARELHDVVGHGLTVVVLQLEAALGLVDSADRGRLRDRLAGIQRSARLALAEMRRLVGLLDEDEEATLSPQPGLRELDRLVADTRAAGVQLDIETTGAPTDLSPGLDLAAFRVAQEALTNVLRHARPPVARLSVSYESGELVVEVTDAGAVNGNTRPTPGRGIAGMQARVALYGGALDVGPQDGGGFQVRARFPLEAAR